MKSRSESVSKPKGTGLAQQSGGMDSTGSSPGNNGYQREQMVAEAAYFRAERRNFAPGDDLADWLQAESDVAALLRSH